MKAHNLSTLSRGHKWVIKVDISPPADPVSKHQGKTNQSCLNYLGGASQKALIRQTWNAPDGLDSVVRVGTVKCYAANLMFGWTSVFFYVTAVVISKCTQGISAKSKD